MRGEQTTIHPAPKHDYISVVFLQQHIPQYGIRHHSQAGLIMKHAQMAHHHATQPAHAVIVTVTMKIRMKTAGDWYVQVFRHFKRCPAERTFCGDMHNIWPVFLPLLTQLRQHRHAKTQALITRNRQARYQHMSNTMLRFNMHIRFTTITLLPWSDYLYLPAFGQHAMYQPLQGHGNAIDLWWPGFRD